MDWREGTEGKGDAVGEVAVGKQSHCLKRRIEIGSLEARGWTFWATRSSMLLEKSRPMTLTVRSEAMRKRGSLLCFG